MDGKSPQDRCVGPRGIYLCGAHRALRLLQQPSSPPRRAHASSPTRTHTQHPTRDHILTILRRVEVNLLLPTPAINIGPDPNTNEWKSAIVGYPLWLWTTTPTTLTRTATHDNLTFTLTAHPTQTHFNFGDNTTHTCTTMTPYDTSLPPGTPSPTCGHTYEQALPHHTPYTITATTTWNWTVPGLVEDGGMFRGFLNLGGIDDGIDTEGVYRGV